MVIAPRALNTTQVWKKNVLEKPIEIIHFATGNESALMLQPRNLIVIEENSQAEIIESHQSLTENPIFTNSVTEIIAKQSSRLNIVKMQNEHNMATQLSSTFISQRKDSFVSTNIISLHGGMIRNNVQVRMEEEGCENHTFGLYLVDKQQHVSNHTIVEHANQQTHQGCQEQV